MREISCAHIAAKCHDNWGADEHEIITYEVDRPHSLAEGD